MINQLRKIYPSLIIYSEDQDNVDHTYKWFVMNDDIIGIQEDELTQKDTSVLATFLVPYNINFPIPTDEEKKWSKAIDSTESSANVDLKWASLYRFVYFSIKKMKWILLSLKVQYRNYLLNQSLFYGPMAMKGSL